MILTTGISHSHSSLLHLQRLHIVKSINVGATSLIDGHPVITYTLNRCNIGACETLAYAGTYSGLHNAVKPTI